MNVKCPNCRFKFDVNPTDVNEQNEVNCTCPRCGKAFTSQYIAPVTEQPAEAPIQQPSPSAAPPSPAISQEQETDLYYAVMKRMKAGQHEEAGIYLEKLLAMKPDEPMYLDIKKQLDGIKQSYLLANKYIRTGQWNLARLYIDDLLKANPNEPMYLSLQEELIEAQRAEAQRQEMLRQQEEQRREEQRKHEEAEKEAAQKEEEAQRMKMLKEKAKGNNLLIAPILKYSIWIFMVFLAISTLSDMFLVLFHWEKAGFFLEGMNKTAFALTCLIFIAHFVFAYRILRDEQNKKTKLKILLPLSFIVVFFLFVFFKYNNHYYYVANFTSGSILTVVDFVEEISRSDLGIAFALLICVICYYSVWSYCGSGFWNVYDSIIDVVGQEQLVRQKKVTRRCFSIVLGVLAFLLLYYIFKIVTS